MWLASPASRKGEHRLMDGAELIEAPYEYDRAWQPDWVAGQKDAMCVSQKL